MRLASNVTLRALRVAGAGDADGSLRAAACLFLLACAACASAADDDTQKEKLGTVIGIDLGTTCATDTDVFELV